ncbi:glycosyltransferase family 4 protein [Pontibacter toksunensis]|uniref:Glycosyltransferase family 4 protein n=1 Tax=Pontibacter toksunensis TaxID=1332631 RepID=A0ABW6BP93_9BACT
MKIAYFLPSLANKGPVIVVRDIVSHLKNLAEIDVYYFDPIEEVIMGCSTRRISMFESIDFEKYDILHSHMLRPDAYLYLHQRKIKGKRISTLHNYVEADLRNSYNGIISFTFTKLWKLLLSKHDLLVALSAHMKDYYLNLYGNKKVSHIYNGRNVNKAESASISKEDVEVIMNFKGNSLLLGAAAELTDRKGIDQSLYLLAQNPELKLLIVGDGPRKKFLTDLSIKLQVHDRCLFLGYRHNGFRYYRFFDIYAMTSRSEGFPLALIEAAAFGLPTLSSDLPVFKETFTDKEVSFYLLENIDSMQQAFEKLVKNRKEYSTNICSKYFRCYTAQTMALNYLETYKKLIGSEV